MHHDFYPTSKRKIELELLAVVWAIENLKHFVHGKARDGVRS